MSAVLPPLVWKRSPNQSSRNGSPVTHLVWHSTIGPYAPSVAWLCNPRSQASAHIVLDETGAHATQLVALDAKAWHAFPFWNLRAVGVEHASRTPGFTGYDQARESARVFAWLCHHLGIPPEPGVGRPSGIVRHRDLGESGGNHGDGPSDGAWFDVFLPAVQAELRRGGFRPRWAR